jgi:hypothetical protein
VCVCPRRLQWPMVTTGCDENLETLLLRGEWGEGGCYALLVCYLRT